MSAGSETLLVRTTPPVLNASLRFVPMPSAQPSPEGSPCAAMPACCPLASRLGRTHSSTVLLDVPTVAVIVSVLARPTAVPASRNGPATPSEGAPTKLPSRSFGEASCATVPVVSDSRR